MWLAAIARQLASGDGSSEGAYLGVAAILTAAGGLIASVVQLLRVLRAPRRNFHHDDEDD